MQLIEDREMSLIVMDQMAKHYNSVFANINEIATENKHLNALYGQSTEHTVKSPSLYTPMGPMLTPMLRLADGWDDAAY